MNDETIVVGVDGSPVSRMALRWAVEEAKLRGCAVEAVLAWHVDYGMVIGPMSATVAAGMDRQAHGRDVEPAVLVVGREHAGDSDRRRGDRRPS